MSITPKEYDLLRYVADQDAMSTTLITQALLNAAPSWPPKPTGNAHEYRRMRRKVYRMLRSEENIWFWSRKDRHHRRWGITERGRRAIAEYEAQVAAGAGRP